MIICSLCFPISFIKYLKECNEWQTKPKIAEPYLPVNCAFASQNCHKYAFCCHHYTMRLIDTSYLRKMDKHFCTKYFHRLLLQYNSRLLSHSTPTHRPLTKWPPFPGPFFMNENIIILITICFPGPINNRLALVQIMARCRTREEPVPEPILTQATHPYMWHYGEINYIPWHLWEDISTVTNLYFTK